MTTEKECWDEAFCIYSAAKELVSRGQKLLEEVKEQGYSDIADYFESATSMTCGKKDDNVAVILDAHPSLYRDYDDEGNLRDGHTPAPDLINRPCAICPENCALKPFKRIVSMVRGFGLVV